MQNTSGSCFWRTVLSVRSRSRSRNAFWKFFMCLSRWCWIDFGLLLELNNNDTRTTLLHGFMLFYSVFLVIFFVLQSLLLALNRFLPIQWRNKFYKSRIKTPEQYFWFPFWHLFFEFELFILTRLMWYWSGINSYFNCEISTGSFLEDFHFKPSAGVCF